MATGNLEEELIILNKHFLGVIQKFLKKDLMNKFQI